MWLTLVSVVIGLVIAFPLAVNASRQRWVVSPITWISGVFYTIPAFAFIVLLIPITGLSLTTVAIPLITYSLLILFRNSLAGLDAVDRDVKEAAVGMGFEPRQLLWRVEVPLAMPVIIAGVRIATVSLDRTDHDRVADRSRWVRTVHPRRPQHVLLDAPDGGRGALGGLGVAGGPAAAVAPANGDALDEGGRDPGGGHVNVFLDGLQWLDRPRSTGRGRTASRSGCGSTCRCR